MTRDDRKMENALLAVLLFHRTGTWTGQRQREWQALTGKEDVTAAVLCDTVRRALPNARVPFADCPPGLFLFNGHVCLKTQYDGNPYILDTGEAFWGGTTSADDRDRLTVTPLDPGQITAIV